MRKSQLDANTYGVGELITQRKLFEVPEHQRDYSWSVEEATQFLDDINSALITDAPDYFIGLVVLQGPKGGVWEILDGQQRLATTTMIYSAIREWLLSRDFSDDAKQIETEFIGVRQLGGEFNSRLRLNVSNHFIFEDYVLRNRPVDELSSRARSFPKSSSNRGLLEVAVAIRLWIASFCTRERSEEVAAQAKRLFQLSTYIESKVKVVCVDVSAEADPYILFEALNDRGADLSALDLVKNHIFSNIHSSNGATIRKSWEEMARSIESRDADDFLKVFWTSRFGIVQKTDLFRKIRTNYQGVVGSQSLAEQLSRAANLLSWVEDRQHAFWNDFRIIARDYLHQLEIIGSKQFRPVLISALSKFDPDEFTSFLWTLIVLLVRYQLVGKGRTGVLEKTLGPLAAAIWQGEVKTTTAAEERLSSIVPSDEDFVYNFARHIEAKASRAIYLLAGINQALTGAQHLPPAIGNVTEAVASISPILLPFEATYLIDGDAPREYRFVGNYYLIDVELMERIQAVPYDQKPTIMALSQFELTKRASLVPQGSGIESIRALSSDYAALAPQVWSFNRPRY